MKTWLDWFVYHYADRFALEVPSKLEQNKLLRSYNLTTKNHNFEIGKASIDIAANAIQHVGMSTIKNDPKRSQLEASLVLFANMYCHPETYSNHVKAIKMSSGLVDTFAGAKAPSIEFKDLGFPPLVSAYIDLPLLKVEIFKNLYLKAIFIGDSSNINSNPIIQFVLSEGNRLSCEWVIFSLWDGDYFTYNLPVKILQSHSNEKITEILQKAYSIAKNITTLTLLYNSIADKAQRHPVPSLDIKAASKLSRKKVQSKQKTHTLFSISELSPPVDNFGRVKSSTNGSSWSLNHAFEVAGHFRWQSYGAGNKLRKLIWIDPYEKGSGQTRTTLRVAR